MTLTLHNAKLILIVLFTFFFTFTIPQWSPPIRLDDKCETELRRATMFSDQSSKITHFFWCQYDSWERKFNLLYRRQYPNGILSSVEELDNEHECEHVSVTGAHDGEQLFVAYAADRRSKHTHCGMDTRDGCLDIYTINSADGGFTWSRVMAVPRTNMDDIWNRQYPKVIMNPATGRVWIFYVLSNVEAETFSLGFVTRPEGSTIYSLERLLGYRKELIMEVTVALSKYNGNAMIHLVWTGEVQKQLHLMQAISANNGDSWQTTEIIQPGFAGRFTSDIRIDPGYMVLPYLHSQSSSAQIAVSNDWARSWNMITISQHPGIADSAICYKTGKNDAIVVALLNAEVSENKFNGEFGYMRVTDGQWIKGGNPFGNMNVAYDPSIRCYVENGKYVIKAVAIEDSDDGMQKIFLSTLVLP